ncbi:MAG: amidohydrolase [Opitutus sp.]|nr:amidohydrolase [Opitutus sp.]
MNDPRFSRRRFLQATGVASLAAAAGVRPDSRAGEIPRPLRIDTHVHCFAGTDDARFPYHERGPYRPPAAATPEHLLRCMREAQVDHAIIVHPEPYQDDHRYLEHCLQIGKGRLKGTLLVFADQPASLAKVPDLCRRLDIVALRVHAHTADRLPPFGKPELRRLWRLAAENHLAVQLHFVPRYAAGFEPLIREFPETKVIIDHLGRPFQGPPEEHAVVMGWAKLPNTIMKLSSLAAAEADPKVTLAAMIRRLTDAWGADRMIYGDSFGPDTTGATYAQAFTRTQSHLAHLSPADQHKIFGGTAQRLFGF